VVAWNDVFAYRRFSLVPDAPKNTAIASSIPGSDIDHPALAYCRSLILAG
jgi:hypothetical protein